MKLLPNLLLVTANEVILEECRDAVTPMHWPLTEVESSHDALCILENPDNKIDVLLIDLILPEGDGISLASEVTRKFSSIKRIMLAEEPNKSDLLRAINKGHVQNLFTLPIQRIQLHEAILHAYKTKQWDDKRKSQEEKLQNRYTTLKVKSKDLKTKAQQIQNQNRGLHKDLINRVQELEQTSLFFDAAKQDLTQAYSQSVDVFTALLELHCRKQGRGKEIVELATAMAHEYQLPPYDIQQITYAAQLTEACKVVLKDQLTYKPLASLSATEQKVYQTYPLIAQSVLTSLEQFRGAAAYLRNIEENIDGTGFPDHLQGQAIPICSQILRLVRDYLAMVHGDQNAEVMTSRDALKALYKETDHAYNKELFERFNNLIIQREQDLANTRSQTPNVAPAS